MKLSDYAKKIGITSYLPHPHEWNLKNVQYSCGF
jgi:hypothetical protein